MGLDIPEWSADIYNDESDSWLINDLWNEHSDDDDDDGVSIKVKALDADLFKQSVQLTE